MQNRNQPVRGIWDLVFGGKDKYGSGGTKG
jgi:hypothetical protein